MSYVGVLEDLPSRKKAALKRQGSDDVYSYDVIPNKLRAQIIQIWYSTLGDSGRFASYDNDSIRNVLQNYDPVVLLLREEYGKHCLIEGVGRGIDPQIELVNFFENEATTDQVLDVITLTFRIIAEMEHGERAIQSVNTRFRDNSVGYEFDHNNLLRIDSEVVHAESVLPALRLLNRSRFEAAEAEYLNAHKHYRKGEYEAAITESLKALESTLKVICKNKGWQYSETDNVSKLIAVVFDNGLVDSHMQSHFSALRSVLESGVPTVRNKQGGHGSGTTLRQVPKHIASFAVHTAATAIVLLVESSEA